MGKYWRIDVADHCFCEVKGKTLKGKTTSWKPYHTFVLGMAATYCVGPHITRRAMESLCLASNKARSAGRKGGVSYGQPLGQGKDIGGEERLKKINQKEQVPEREERAGVKQGDKREKTLKGAM